MSMRRLEHIATAAAVVVALCPMLPEAARADPPALEITGVVLDATGAPVPAAWVGVYLWPNVVPTTIGATIDEPLLAESVSNQDGSYTLAIPPTQILADTTAADGGYVNLELRAAGAGFSFTTRFSRSVAAPAAGIDPPDAEPLTISMSSRTIGATRLTGPESGRRAPPTCLPWTVDADLGFRDTTVGELHSWNKISSYFTYGSSADSTIDIAFKSPSSPNWGSNGSVHIGNASSQGTAGRTVSATSSMPATGYAATGVFHYQELKQSCSGAGTQYEREADRWNGADVFLDTDEPISGFDGRCGTTYAPFAHQFSPGQASWSRTAGASYHFGGAVDLGVFQAGASSGFSASASITFRHPNTGSTWWLCGDDGDYLHAHRIFAGR